MVPGHVAAALQQFSILYKEVALILLSTALQNAMGDKGSILICLILPSLCIPIIPLNLNRGKDTENILEMTKKGDAQQMDRWNLNWHKAWNIQTSFRQSQRIYNGTFFLTLKKVQYFNSPLQVSLCLCCVLCIIWNREDKTQFCSHWKTINATKWFKIRYGYQQGWRKHYIKLMMRLKLLWYWTPYLKSVPNKNVKKRILCSE